MTVAKEILIRLQSNGINASTNGVAYPGGWTAPSFGAGWLEIAWIGTSWAQYVPGSTSYGTQPYWGPEASILLAKRAITPLCQTYVHKFNIGGVGMAQNQGQRGASGDGNDWSPWTNRGFATSCNDLATANAVLAALGLTVEIDECYLIGNESDCFDWAAASALMHDLPAYISALRVNFSCPDMKVVIARTKATLGSGSASPSPGKLPYVDLVRAAQVAAGCGYRCAWVDCDDLPSGTYSAGHYDPSGVVTLGTRLAAAAAAIT